MKTNVYILSFVLIIFSCKKEDLVFSGDLNFSNDTVMDSDEEEPFLFQ